MIFERFERVDRKLHDGDVRLRIEMGKHAPRSVIESPLVDVETDPLRLHDFRDFLSKFRISGSRIIEIEQVLRKAVEIVDRARPCASR